MYLNLLVIGDLFQLALELMLYLNLLAIDDLFQLVPLSLCLKFLQMQLVIDDLLATGGTIKAANKLIEQLGGEVVGCAFLIELVDLKGREQLEGYNVKSLMTY